MAHENACGYNSSGEPQIHFQEEIGGKSACVEPVDAPNVSQLVVPAGGILDDGGDSLSGSFDEVFAPEESQQQKRLIKKAKLQNNLPRQKRVQLRSPAMNVVHQQQQKKKSSRRNHHNLILTAGQRQPVVGYSMPAFKQLLGVTGNQRVQNSIADTNGGGSGPSNGQEQQGRRGDNNSSSVGGKRPVRAKQNEMYLITTLLPGKPNSGGNGGLGNMQPGLINKVLPMELVLRIFSFLDIISLCRCAQVCRYWNRLAMDGSNWQDVDLFFFQRDVKTSVVENLAKRCGTFLKGLSLRGCENIQDSAMRSFALKCPNIERLMLTKCRLITDATCEYIGRYCHRLVILDLENCPEITDLTCKFISEGCKSLEELNIGWCLQITDLGIGYIARGCPNLTTLICKGCSGLSFSCFAQLGPCQLRKLSLFSCPSVTDDTVANVAGQCHKLEFLSLSNCKEITDQALHFIAKGCPKIRIIEFAECQNLTDNGFVSLAKNCHELERMDLEECTLITDTTLIHLKAGCPNLSSLSLSHCENLTDHGLSELCNSHKNCLQVLELDNCPNITDATLECMKILRFLERIDLYDCQGISKDAIRKFKQMRPEVEVHAYFAPATPPAQPPPARRGICRCCAII